MTFNSKPIATIGSKEFVDFPSLQLKHVPAKVDTGAYSSVIWASKVKAIKGVLHYVLFDRQSPFYSGKELVSPTFTVTAVRNSFGQSELRYKIKLKVVIAGRPIITNFTLANRTHNRLPVLIGRRVLNSKFVVDVSREQRKNHQELLILAFNHDLSIVQKFINPLREFNDKLNVTVATYDNLDFTLGKHLSKIVLNDSARDIASFDMVYFKSVSGNRPNKDIIAATAQYLQKRGVYFVDQVAGNTPSGSKLFQYVVLNDNGITTPLSIFVAKNKIKDSYERFSTVLGLPFILKDIYGSKGRENYLIRNKTAFRKICKVIDEKELHMIAQAYVDNDGDYRVLTFGRKIVLVIYRQRKNKATHLNNVSRGGKARLEDTSVLPGKVQKWSVLAVNILQRDVAGVDMVRDKQTDSWYCLEVNEGPQIATGAFVTEKQVAFAKFIDEELRRE